jgi:hypothetical protein
MKAPFDTVSMLSSLVSLIGSVDWVRHLDLYILLYGSMCDGVSTQYAL